MSIRISRPGATTAFLGLLALGQFGAQLAYLGQGLERTIVTCSIDDTYYYLQTAWNLVHQGWVTFDGLHPTSGVQLLWFGVVTALAALVPSKTALALAVLAVCALLNAAVYLFIGRVGRTLGCPGFTVALAGLWSLQHFGTKVYISGMESSLHALAVWWVVSEAVGFLDAVRQGRSPGFVGLTAALVVNAWTRYDSGLLSAVVYAVCLGMLLSRVGSLRAFLRNHGRSLAWSAAAAAAALGLELAVYHRLDGTLAPVSGLVKAAGGDTSGPFSGDMLWLLKASLSVAALFGTPTVAVGLAAALLLPRWQPLAVAVVRPVWIALAVAWVLTQGLLAGTGVLTAARGWTYAWYNAPWVVLWILSVALVAEAAGSRLVRWWRLPSHPATVALTIIGAVTLAASVDAFYHRYTQPLDTDHHYLRVHRAARWMDANLPADAVCAAWNAGQLGYYGGRPVVNLDGLVNSSAYFEDVMGRPGSLEGYLRGAGVGFVVDNVYGNITFRHVAGAVDTLPANSVLVHEFSPASNGRVMKVWSLRGDGSISAAGSP